MAATEPQIARLRRMVAEPDDSTYNDTDLASYIEQHPLIDELGTEPFIVDSTTRPPTQDPNPDWIATYDLHVAAADVWEEKASALAGDYDFAADGGNYSRSQAYEQAMKQARWHRSRRAPGGIAVMVYPKPGDTQLLPIGNLAESD